MCTNIVGYTIYIVEYKRIIIKIHKYKYKILKEKNIFITL